MKNNLYFNFNRNKKNKKKIALLFLSFCLLVIIGTSTVLGIMFKNEQNKISKIVVSITPQDTYFVGEQLNTDKLSIQVIKKNGKFYFIDDEECTFSGFDSSKPIENQIITVTYKDFKCTFTVTIKELPQSVPVLVGIHLDELPKTEYKVGESLDTTGGVIVREYKDGSRKFVNLINSYVFGFTSEEPGTYTLTIIYVENGIQVQTTYEIIVTV